MRANEKTVIAGPRHTAMEGPSTQGGDRVDLNRLTPLLRRRSDQAEASLRSFPRAQESTRKAIGQVVGCGLALSVPVSRTGMVQYTARRIDYLVGAAQVLARSEYVGSVSAERSQRVAR